MTATSWTGDSVTEAVDGCCGGGVVDGRRDRLKKRGAFLVGLAEASSDEAGRLSVVFWGLHVLAGTLIEVDCVIVIALFAVVVGGLELIPLAKEVTGNGGGIFSLSSLLFTSVVIVGPFVCEEGTGFIVSGFDSSFFSGMAVIVSWTGLSSLTGTFFSSVSFIPFFNGNGTTGGEMQLGDAVY